MTATSQKSRTRQRFRCGLLVLLMLAATGPVAAQECANLELLDSASGPAERLSICRAAERAQEFLASCGIDTTQRIRVRVTDRLSTRHHAYAIASYDQGRQEISLLDRVHAIMQITPGTPYSRLSPDELHASLVAHELAHAIVLQQPGSHDLTRMAHEYMAAVVQIATLEPASRQLLMQGFPRRSPVETAALNGFTFNVAPQWFAVNAYRHYAAAIDGCARLRGVLAGELRFVDNPE